MPLDIYQSVTDRIVAQLENNPGKWEMPWRKTGINQMPVSADGRSYRGINTLVLWCSAIENGYSSPIWATYNQWKRHNCQVQRGEKSTMVVFWKPTTKYNHETGKDDKVLFAKAFSVFNIAQTDGASRFPVTVTPASSYPNQHIMDVDDFFSSCDAKVNLGGDRAFYSPGGDFIQVPNMDQFHSANDYYSTLGHEHIHWTGHKSRLNRELLSSRFGDEAYAFEELVAEIGAAFLCAHLGLENEPREDHAKYLNSWLQVLKHDKRAIITAASKAQKAVDYLVAFQPGGSDEAEDMEDAQ